MKDGSLWVATDIGGIKVVGNPHPAPDGGLHYAKVAVSASSLNTRSIVEDEYGRPTILSLRPTAFSPPGDSPSAMPRTSR